MRAKLTIFFTILSLMGFGQFDHLAVFPGESGQSLIDKLVSDYKPEEVLDFSSAKDVMYRDIYALNDSVSCVYTGHKLYLDPDADPSSWLFQNGSNTGINAEHNYPKSKGASSGNALSDLYNLFPTRTPVNADRGNLPFGEIPDEETNSWYYLTEETGNIPTTGIDLYSESDGKLFEPREDHKGNVARAVFYFITMYGSKSMAADPHFFELMRPTLCGWHFDDPVDSLEWVRNDRIASFQSDKLNPFILDCSLASRTYCETVDDACTMTANSGFNETRLPDLDVFPNPASDWITISGIDTRLEGIQVEIFNLMGELMISEALMVALNSGNGFEVHVDCRVLSPGIYLMGMAGLNNSRQNVQFRKLVIQ